MKRFLANDYERALPARQRHTASKHTGNCNKPDEDAGDADEQCTAS